MSLASATNTYLSDLINVGADAMNNLYYLEFSGTLLNADEELKLGMKVRNKDFTPPTFTQVGPNTVNFMTTSLDWPLAAISGDKKLSLTFRLDEHYAIYEYLLKQKSVTGNANLAFANNEVPDSENGGFKIDVYAFDRSLASETEDIANPESIECYRKMYTFEYCWVMDISGLDYSYNNQAALTVKVDIGFFQFDDPMNLLFK